MKCFLISFQANHIIAMFGHHFFYCFLLAVHRITCKNTIFHFNQIKKLRNSSNFVAFLIYTHLSEYNSSFICPSTDYMDKAVIILTTSTNCFSIQTDDFIFFHCKYRLYPLSETFLQLFRLDNGKNSLKGVICRHSVFQF